MATTDAHPADANSEPLTLSHEAGGRLLKLFAVLGGFGLVAGLLFAFLFGGVEDGLRRLFLSYLVAFVFALTIALGALFFVMLQHITRAGWSVNVRRVPEAMAMTMPALAVLALPILLSLLITGTSGHPTLYPWATPTLPAEHGKEADVTDAGDTALAGEAGPGPEHGEKGISEGRAADVIGEINPTVVGEGIAPGVARPASRRTRCSPSRP